MKHLIHKLRTQEKWNIGIVTGTPMGFWRVQSRVQWMPEVSGKFYADPFCIVRKSVVHIFAEEFSYRKDRGRIVHIVATKRGKSFHFSQPTPVIEADTHMSYPFLIEDNGELYCVPENADSGSVTLYRCINFPHEWKKETVLIQNFRGIDPTIVRHKKTWYLFATQQEKNGKSNRELHLFYAQALYGPWKHHPENPVKDDSGSARPAGGLFVHYGKLMRPAQDCSNSYGRAIVLNTITKLSKEKFDEQSSGKVFLPCAPYSEGLHTLSYSSGVIVVDGKYCAPISDALRRVIPRCKQKMALVQTEIVGS